MEELVTWYWISMKQKVKSMSFWIEMILFVLLIWTLGTISETLPSSRNTMVGIYAGNSQVGQKLQKILLNENQRSSFQFVLVDSEEKLKDQVLSGKTECGFSFADNLDEKIKDGDTKYAITYFSSCFTTKGLIVKEDVYADFFKEYSRQILKQSESMIFHFPNKAEEKKLDEEIQEKYEEYLESDEVFSIRFTTLDSVIDCKELPGVRTTIMPGIISTLVFMYLFFTYGTLVFSEQEYGWRFYPLNKKRRYLVARYGSQNVIMVIIGFVLLCRYSPNVTMLMQIAAYGLFLAFSLLWIFLFHKICRKEWIHNSCIVPLFLINIVACLAFYQENFVEDIWRYAGYLLPVGGYLNLMQM